MTFDLDYFFSKPFKLININILKNGYSQHKLLYLERNNDFLIISNIKSNYCKIYTSYFNSKFEIKYQGVIDNNNIQCRNINLFSSFFNSTIYTIINENNTYFLKILYQKKRNLSPIPEKCSESTPESKILNLCLSCSEGYFPTTPIYNSNFIDCFSEHTKPNNFYFDNIDNKYKTCYETCETCERGGTPFNNN